MSQKITVQADGERLDKRLTSQFPYSRNFFRHIIERGGVQKATKKSTELTTLKKSYKVKQGDKIVIDDLQRFLDGGILEEATWVDLPIIHETDDYIVINKPKGVLSHPNSIRDVKTPSVVARAHHHFKELPSTGNFIRAGLIHRLDKDTDGFMILAKTEIGLSHFKDLFQRKSGAKTVEDKEAVPLKKCYRATCDLTDVGQQFLDDIHSTLPHYVIKDVIPKTPHAVVKNGITKVVDFSIDQNAQSVTLYLEILTGRTHQIRYHLSSLGLPIQGDYLYNPTHDDKKGISLQLTSYKLVFEDTNHSMQTFTSESQ